MTTLLNMVTGLYKILSGFGRALTYQLNWGDICIICLYMCRVLIHNWLSTPVCITCNDITLRAIYDTCIFKGISLSSVFRVNWSSPCAGYMSVNWVSIGSNNGLLPIRHQAIIFTNVGLLSTGLQGTNFRECLTKIKKPFHSWKEILKYCLKNGDYFVQARWFQQVTSEMQHTTWMIHI